MVSRFYYLYGSKMPNLSAKAKGSHNQLMVNEIAQRIYQDLVSEVASAGSY